MNKRYVNVKLDIEKDIIIEVISYADDLPEFKPLNGKVYSVDFVGVNIEKYQNHREMILDLEYDADESLKMSNIQSIHIKNIIIFYNTYLKVYDNYIRSEKIRRLDENIK